MCLGNNIYSAFEVVNKTHENVSKLIDYCKVVSLEKKEYELMSPKFLRYKSDADYCGWNTSQFFLLFQDTEDRRLKNGWRNGPIYVLEITLYNTEYDNIFASDEPWVQLSKFEYDDIKSLSPGVSPTNYYYFTSPLYDVDYKETKSGISSANIPDAVSQRCWGVKRVVRKAIPLVSINSKNAYKQIFGTFKALKNK